MRKTTLVAAACAVVFTLNHSSHAQQLLEWDMDGVDQSTRTLAASVSDGNISLAGSSGLLSRGVGAVLPGSLEGFSTGDAIASYAITTAAGGGDQSFDFSGDPAFQSLTTAVEFRIYAWNGGTGTTDKFRLRNLASGDLEIDGTTALIPEPSTHLLALAAMAGLITLRRPSHAVGQPEAEGKGFRDTLGPNGRSFSCPMDRPALSGPSHGVRSGLTMH